MTERKNVFQKIIEKPKQAIINFTTMVKTRIAQAEEKERQQREIYLTTPPKEGQPTIRYEQSNSGVFLNGGAFTRYEYTWSPETQRWQKTNSKQIIISGTSH